MDELFFQSVISWQLGRFEVPWRFLCNTAFRITMQMKNKNALIDSGTLFQLFAAVIANLMAISDGMTVGWSAPMIPYFISEESHIPMDRHQAEWIENWVLIGAVAGLPFTIYLVDKVGRKKSLLLASLNLLVAWVIIAFSKTLVHLYVARFISGIGGDMAFVAAPMYIAEIADQKIRGFLSSIIYLMMLTGVITVYIVGPYLPFYVPPVIGGILLIIELIVFSFLPETPYFLAFNGKHEEARKSLEKFRSGRSIEKEITEIHIAVERRRSEKGRIQDIFHVKNYRKAMLIMTVLNAAQQLSSINVILMNMHQILEEAGSIYVDPMIAAIIFASLMFVAALTASGTIDKFGRKALLIFSSIMTGFCLLSLAIYFNIKNSGMEWRSISWIPIASLMVYALVFKYGLGMVPIVITAEIFAPEMKAVGMTIADAVFVLAAIGSINLFQKLSGDYGMHVPFYISACCSFLTTLYVALFIPETKGKTLEEIQLILQGKSKAKPYIKTNDEVQVEK
ncbi:hypothetical protein JTB14_021047 [Gonioctena quinquepunctata]|nr:hypothetical protein JTB14_021047 [Gonioctena quinquepunctata]